MHTKSEKISEFYFVDEFGISKVENKREEEIFREYEDKFRELLYLRLGQLSADSNYLVITEMKCKILLRKFYSFLGKKELIQDVKVPIRIITIAELKDDKFNPESESSTPQRYEVLKLK